MEMEEVDWQAIANQYQRDNEKLRLQIYRSRNTSINLLPVAMDFMTWVEKHYLFVIAMAVIVNYAVDSLVDIIQLQRSGSYGRRR